MPKRPITTARLLLHARLPLGLLALPAGLVLPLLGCGSDGEGAGAPLPDPPLPENLAELDPRAAARIEEAVAQVRAEPRRAQAWADLGAIYFTERLKALAIDCTRAAETLEPEQPKWPYRAAIMLAQNGALEQAGVAMERALALEPSYPPSHARLGNYRFQLGDLDGAERAFRAAIALDTTYPGGWVGLARVELQRDQAPEAVAILERLAREDPESHTFRQLLAAARRQVDPSAPVEPESVLGDEEVPVWNDPWELELHAFSRMPFMQQVHLLMERGEVERALPLLEEERARGGDADELALLFAGAYEQRGDLDAARRELAALFARQPDNVRALLLQARLQDRAGDVAGVVQTLERVTTLQPREGGVFAAKGDKLAQLGEQEAAVAAYRRALELGLHDFGLRAALGNSLVVLRRWPEAIELFEAMLAERPAAGDVWLQLALARLRSGALDEAAQALERGQATGNASPRLYENVRKALEETRARKKPAGAGETPAEGERR